MAPRARTAFAKLAGLAAAAVVAACGGRGAAPPPESAGPKLSEAEILAVKNPHAARPRAFCWSCHVTDTRRELRQDPVALCRRCHPAAAHGNHPVDVSQKTSAGRLPLWKGGRVVCHTCHDPHDLAKKPHGLRLDFNPLCVECHKPGASQRHGEHAGGHGKGSPATPLPPAAR